MFIIFQVILGLMFAGYSGAVAGVAESRHPEAERLRKQNRNLIDTLMARAHALGETTPHSFASLRPGDSLHFSDGSQFEIETIRRLNGGFFVVQIKNFDCSACPSFDVAEVELIVPAYSDVNIELLVASDHSLNQKPREILMVMREVKGTGISEVPIRKFHYIDPQGRYAIAEQIPFYDEKSMDLYRFIRDKGLTPEQRSELAERYLDFVRAALRSSMPSLSLGSTLLFDPRDRTWKLAIGNHLLHKGQHAARIATIVMEAPLSVGSTGDNFFFQELYKQLSTLD